MEVAVSLSILQLVKILIMDTICISAALWAVRCQYQWETGCSWMKRSSRPSELPSSWVRQ